MKFTLPVLFALLTGVLAAIHVPTGTTGAVVQAQGQLRIYHQTSDSSGISEISVASPPAAPVADYVVFPGPTRQDTPLAAVSWVQDKQTEIRVYFITPQNTLGEVGFVKGKWDWGNLQIDVLPFSALLYATKLDKKLVVGYTNAKGSLSEAWTEIGGSNGWLTYVIN